ncbi:MAG TPA: hypothetical protein VGF29_18700 [Hyphomicrobiaceae bacterium]
MIDIAADVTAPLAESTAQNTMSEVALFLGDILMGFVLALPFAFVRHYLLRIILCAAAPLVVWRILLVYVAHAGFRWNYVGALTLILGALLAAHLRELWWLARRLSHK